MDLMTYKMMANSYDFKEGLQARGFTPLNTHTAISKEVQEYAAQVRADKIKYLTSRIKSGLKVSVSTDEYTAKNRRRYSALNVHNPEWLAIGIGMIRIVGSLTADIAAQELTDKLLQFGVSVKRDMVASSTDGASVMIKLGDILGALHQVCHSHGIHLGVVEILYKVS